jgi:hypothetical protein
VLPLFFSSALTADRRGELEDLMFFHPQQQEHSWQINNSIKDYGFPRVIVEGESLRIGIDGHEAQTLYAFVDRGSSLDLAGVLVYSRIESDALTLLHMAVKPEFSYATGYKNEVLLVRILAQLRQIARRIKGVKRIAIAYTAPLPRVPRSDVRVPGSESEVGSRVDDPSTKHLSASVGAAQVAQMIVL